MSKPSRTGTVYLLHFDRPYKHARHYCGWAADLTERLAEHKAGRGARLMAVIGDAGIGWRLARTWTEATRGRERHSASHALTRPVMTTRDVVDIHLHKSQHHQPKENPAMSTTITTEANLVGDPELRFTKVNAQPVCSLRLAVSSRRKNMDGEYVDTPPVFCEGTVWGQLAEHVAESLRKGDRVLVQGTSYDEEWIDRDGGTRIKHVIQIQAIGASLRYATATVHRASTKTQIEQRPEPAPAG